MSLLSPSSLSQFVVRDAQNGVDGSNVEPAGRLACFIAVLWLGILIGVSFLATPVKFQAPSLSLPVALDVGRATFALLSKVEWALALGLLVAAFRTSRRLWVAGGVVLLISLGAQSFWLLPILDARVSQIMEGSSVAPSQYHLVYIATDVLKVAVLLYLSVAGQNRVRVSDASRIKSARLALDARSDLNAEEFPKSTLERRK